MPDVKIETVAVGLDTRQLYIERALHQAFAASVMMNKGNLTSIYNMRQCFIDVALSPFDPFKKL